MTDRNEMEVRMVGVTGTSDLLETCFSMKLYWDDPEKGFGEFIFWSSKAEDEMVVTEEEPEWHLYIQNEFMSKEYIKKVLCKWVDDATLEEGE